MDSSADLCKQSGAKIDLSGSKSTNQTAKDSSNVNQQAKTSGGRRSSDGGPPPFNRNRSFKTKQLVRSQAIRESQSPPRIPSPRSFGMSDVKSSLAGRAKSASVDLDDRSTCDSVSPSRANFAPAVCEIMSKNVANDANSFKTSNIISKNILVSTSGDIKKLGANVIYSTDSLECKNNIVIDDKAIYTSENTKHSEETISCNEQVHRGITSQSKSIALCNNNDNLKCNKNIAPDDFKCDPSFEDSDTVELDYNRVIDYGNNNINNNNNNDKKSYDLDTREANVDCRSISLQPPQNIKSTKYTHNYNNANENFDCAESQPTTASDREEIKDLPKNKKVSLKNLKNMNPMKPTQITDNRDGITAINEDVTNLEFHPVEIQVTTGDNGSSPEFDDDDFYDNDSEMSPIKSHTNDKEDNVKKQSKSSNPTSEGRRAMQPSKQDSGVSCWDSSNCCGDVSPEIIMFDTEDSVSQIKHHAGCPEHENQLSNLENSRNGEKSTNRQGSMLTVENSSSGGNQRLLRKQSSGGSMDSGKHSISSPFLSRDNSTEYMGPCEVADINDYIKETLNKTLKDRNLILRLETEFVGFMRDPSRREHKFPAHSSYARLLVHRCAQLFGLRHGPDPVTRSLVHVAKLSHVGASFHLPLLCPLQQWCTTVFQPENPSTPPEDPPAKSILKRDTQSLDDEPSVIPTAPPKLVQTPRSKSFEQREEEYVKARRRIFNSPGQGGADRPWIWDGTMYNEAENELYRPRILMPPDHGKSARLLKVQSLEHENTPVPNRGVVSKAHSFGGYGGRLQRGDSVAYTSGAPPQRILSRQGELASNSWRLSPCSSGYKTLSARSESITPSPTSTPHVANSVNGNKNALGDATTPAANNNCVMGGVLWAITDMSTVPAGAIIIQPQSGQALTNNDGSLYHFDPGKPLHSALLPCTQTPTENIRVLSNPERRRSRLEKQRATISPGTESDNSSGETKISNTAVPDASKNATVSDYSQKNKTQDLNKNTNVPTTPLTDNPNYKDNKSTIESSTNINEETTSPDNNKTHNTISSNDGYTNQAYAQNNYSSPETFVGGYNTCSTSLNNNFSNKHGNLIEYAEKNHNSEVVQHHFREDDCSRIFMNMNINNNGTNENNVIVYNNGLQNYAEIVNDQKHLGYYDQRERIVEMENKCIDQRQMDNYVMASYPEIHGPGFYVQPNTPQYYGAPIYDEANPELYPGQPQPMGYGMRPNEPLLQTPPHQMHPPQLIYATQPDNTIGYAPANELCYPTCSAPMLIQQPHYRLQETDPQQPYLISSADQQQPMIVALSNKLPETEMTPQLSSYPVTYPPHVERPPIIGSSPTIVAAPHHPAMGYQIQGTSSWSCWPPLALYTSHPQPPPDDGTQKYQPQHNTYIAQPPEAAVLNTTNISAIPQTFFPHPNVIQPNQYYPSYQPAQIIQQSYPVYQQYNPGRTSVVSQEGCSTPGFQTYDMNNCSNIPFVQDSLPKSNAKSPKGTNSRNTSNPGSSRATPLNTNIPMQNLAEFNYNNTDSNFAPNYQFIQPPAVNYVPYHYPYHSGMENNYPGNYLEHQYAHQTKASENDNTNNSKVNKNTTPKIFPPVSSTPEKKNVQYGFEKDDSHMKQPPPQINAENNITLLQNTADKKDGYLKTNVDQKLPLNKPLVPKPVDVENIPNILEIDTSQKPPPIPISINQSKHNTNEVNTADTLASRISTPQGNIKSDTQSTLAKKNHFNDNQRVENKTYNNTKNFQHKNQFINSINRNSFPSWNIRENDYRRNDNSYNNIQASLIKQLSVDGNSSDSINPDTRMPWRKNTGYNQRDFHNFPKTYNNRQKFSNAQQEREKFIPQNRNKEKFSNFNNTNQRAKSQPLFDTPPIQITPTALNAPPVPWNLPGAGLSNICSNANSKNVHQYMSSSSISQPLHPSNLLDRPPNMESPLLSAPNNQHTYGKGRMSPLNVCMVAAQQRYLDAMTIPIMQTSIYQRNQAFTNGGLGLMQTPPLQGQSTFLLRQVPGWLRRPPAPTLFGPAPSVPGQVRGKPPRHHQPHSRNLYH